ncbi:mechanosensitive ion channel [Bacteroidales bacterium OttesenSCG-928-K22]|nr:mechanosensitive ion channel [Bacteroidales bacterium OttesenSCG-928-K22]
MNTEEFLSINSSSIIILILEAILLFFVLRMAVKFLPLLPKKEKIRRLLKKHTQIIEIVVWIIFLIHVITKISNIYIQYTIIAALACIILCFLWYYLKDRIIGIIFKTNYNIDIDDYITLNEISGRIKGIKGKYIEVESKNGDIYFINYSDLNKGIFSKQADTEQSSIFSFTIKISTDNYNANKLAEIKKYILTFPSVSTKKAPNIKVAHTNNKHVELTISFISLDEERNDAVMEAVRGKFNE